MGVVKIEKFQTHSIRVRVRVRVRFRVRFKVKFRVTV